MESRKETAKSRKKGEDKMSNRTRQNNKRADRKTEQNDSPDISDREETEEPGFPSGLQFTKVYKPLEAIFYD